MATIVEYTDVKAPQNRYPTRIISPAHAKPCCFTDLAEVGPAQQDGRWESQYKRCRQCGFTVRMIVRELPDAPLIGELRRTLETAFQRNVPDW